MTFFNHQQGQHLHIDGAQIYVETVGDSQATPLVLLHGGLGDLSDFNTLLAQLPRSYYFIGIDLRGHGKSSLGHTELSYTRYQADIEAVLAHLGVSSALFIGFSDGGIAAYHLAATAPQKVQGLVTIGASWRMQADDPALEHLGGLSRELWEQIFPEAIGHYESLNPQPDFDALLAAITRLWTDCAGYPGEVIQRIQAPLLLIRGEADELFSLTEATALMQILPDSHFLNLPFADHAAHEDAPALVANYIQQFFAANAR